MCSFFNRSLFNDSGLEVSRRLSAWILWDLSSFSHSNVKPMGHTCKKCNLNVEMKTNQISLPLLFPERNAPYISSPDAVIIFLWASRSSGVREGLAGSGSSNAWGNTSYSRDFILVLACKIRQDPSILTFAARLLRSRNNGRLFPGLEEIQRLPDLPGDYR